VTLTSTTHISGAAGFVCGVPRGVVSHEPETEAVGRGELHIVLISVGVGAGNVRCEGILRWKVGSWRGR
jgi:hypothetical protein